MRDLARGALLAVLGVAALAAGDGWRPAEHPAPLLRPLSGLTRPLRTLLIASEVPGRLLGPVPALGERIADGSALLIDDAWARADAAVARAQLAAARAAADHQRREAERWEQLRREGRAAEAERAAAQHAAEAAALAVGVAEAELARLELRLARHRLPLPAGWQVLRRWREAGSLVQPGEPILEVGDLSALVVTVHALPEELPALPTAEATVEGRRFPIQAVRIGLLADAQTRKLPVELELPAAAGCGREAVITLRLPDPLGAVLVPKRAILADLDGRFVTGRDGRRIAVRIVRELGEHCAVLPSAELLASELLLPP
ncbi:MAG: HlyD family efflux transporter periplasmic adaptor subunit [Planctomycetota bacterium]|nr:HlyD family efflux transporter periplasmic adaptor subunit [Planctomycetota bacterium]